jgi:nucleoside-diphosphate-sugar epimerase
MDVLVTGGNGFVGHHLIPALLGSGHRVRTLALPGEDTRSLEELDVTVHRGDICRPETLAAPMQGAEAVIHLAAMMHVWRPLRDYRAVNVTGTENVCLAALAVGIRRFVHMSSSSVYGMDWNSTVDEHFPLAPFHDPYPVTKADADRLIQRMIVQAALPAVIVRPDQIFGPGDQLHFGQTADRLSSGKGLIVGRGDNTIPLLYVTDAVQGLMLALEHERAVGQAFNITSERPLTQQEFLEAIAHEVGARPPRRHVPYQVLYAAAYAAERLAVLSAGSHRPPLTRVGVAFLGTNVRFSIDKARCELGYTPQVALREGVRLAADWHRLHHLGPAMSPAVNEPAPQPARGG